jgi:hypothetical protein
MNVSEKLLPPYCALKMEAADFSLYLTTKQRTWCHISENSDLENDDLSQLPL